MTAPTTAPTTALAFPEDVYHTQIKITPTAIIPNEAGKMLSHPELRGSVDTFGLADADNLADPEYNDVIFYVVIDVVLPSRVTRRVILTKDMITCRRCCLAVDKTEAGLMTALMMASVGSGACAAHSNRTWYYYQHRNVLSMPKCIKKAFSTHGAWKAFNCRIPSWFLKKLEVEKWELILE